ncbi:MAG: diguanylate cyclase [Deltaproteobacteria bacterium]|nr:diguanylate cyclase [Deltaproteobacteria bacterium]
MIEMVLSKRGFDVTCAENGKMALDLFRDRFFPMVLTDWMMPEMDGVELCRELRSRQPSGYIYILFLTVRGAREDVVAGLEAGADDYLTKPFHRMELLARISTGNRILKLERSLKRTNEEIRRLSITDPLTGAYNRNYLKETLPKEIKRTLRYGHPLHVIMGDIDHFKAVNDVHGHQVGDEVLRAFTRCIRDSIRNNVDWVVRYGGEEFLVVLPETDEKGALTVAERLRNAVRESAVRVNGNEIRITASWGVSGFRASDPFSRLSHDDLIREADRCLLRAKEDGRNRVRIGGQVQGD